MIKPVHTRNLIAAASGWTIVDMKKDWNSIFPPEKK